MNQSWAVFFIWGFCSARLVVSKWSHKIFSVPKNGPHNDGQKGRRAPRSPLQDGLRMGLCTVGPQLPLMMEMMMGQNNSKQQTANSQQKVIVNMLNPPIGNLLLKGPWNPHPIPLSFQRGSVREGDWNSRPANCRWACPASCKQITRRYYNYFLSLQWILLTSSSNNTIFDPSGIVIISTDGANWKPESFARPSN